ncbi:MAG: hypothetical protein QM770_21245 [Tepidisphaeraceae bacterium]
MSDVMGIRETLNNHPKATGGVVAAMVVTLLGYVVMQATSSGAPSLPDRAYYSDDDGNTWFADDINKPFPFDHKGKQAYLVYVYQCGDKPAYAGVLLRMNADALQRAKALPQGDASYATQFTAIKNQGLEIKKPGAAAWKPLSAAGSQDLMDTAAKCPDGSPAQFLTP